MTGFVSGEDETSHQRLSQQIAAGAALLRTTPRRVLQSFTDDSALARHAYRIGNTKREPHRPKQFLDASSRRDLVDRG